MSIEAMEQALDALEKTITAFGPGLTLQQKAAAALRQAIEQAEHVHAGNTSQERVDETAKGEHEPVAWMYVNKDGECEQIEHGHIIDDPGVTILYTAPQKREWVGLTAEEIWQCNTAPAGHYVEFYVCMAHQNVLDFAEAIEAKLKEKNT